MTPEFAQTIVQQVEQLGLSNATLAQLRQTYPEVHFTYCMDDDITHPQPVMKCQGFNLYLVGGEHCLALTQDYAAASGLVLAEVIEDS